MGQLGIFFALKDKEAAEVLIAAKLRDSDEKVMEIIERIEEKWERDWLFEMDKGWDALHRCLTNGFLEFDNGTYPLSFCVLGGVQLYEGDDYIVSFKSPDEVADIAASLKTLTEAEIRERYEKVDAETYQGEKSQEDFEYTMGCFEGLPQFYARAAQAKRSVIFTVDQ